MNTATSYRDFHLRDINRPEYKHLWWLLFFPIYWLRYPMIEKWNPADFYHPIQCVLDEKIPLVQWFVIPYALWMVSLIVMSIYTLFYDTASFKRYMMFLTVTMSISTVIFLVFPSCQNLRPAELPKDNFLSRCVGFLYTMDTNTNVFPSEHAIGAIAVWLGVMHTKSLRHPGIMVAVTILELLVCASTVFLKQHSVLDVIAAVPVCVVAYLSCYRKISSDKQKC